MICGCRGSKSRLAKTAGAQPCGQMMDEKIARRCGEKHICKLKAENTSRSEHFWKLRSRKSAHRCGAKHISKPKCEEHHMLGPLLDAQMSYRVAGSRDCAPCQKWAKGEGFVVSITMAGVGHLKRICKDVFSVAGAVQETSSSELLGGPGADFLRRVAFWSIRSSGLLRWFCVTGAALRMTWYHFFVASVVV